MSRWTRESYGELLSYVEGHAIDETPLPRWVAAQLDGHGLDRSTAIRGSQLNQTFAYQIIAGDRHASRDKLIQLAFGMRLSSREGSDLLERGGCSRLREDRQRDLVIAFCLDRGVGLVLCDEALWELEERTIVDGEVRG